MMYLYTTHTSQPPSIIKRDISLRKAGFFSKKRDSIIIMVTYYMTSFYVDSRLRERIVGGANYLKMSQQIINAWKTAFTIPTEKQRRGPPGWSSTYLCHRCYDKVAYPSRYDTSWLELSGGSRISQRRVLLKRARKFQSHAHLRVGHAYFNKRRAASDPLHRARSCPRFANRPVFVQYHS